MVYYTFGTGKPCFVVSSDSDEGLERDYSSLEEAVDRFFELETN
jgi:hypothetical protein